MEINIPDNEELGKSRYIKALFWPLFVLLATTAAFGVGKIVHIEQSREPVSIEYPKNYAEQMASSTSTHPPRKLGTSPLQEQETPPPLKGGVAEGRGGNGTTAEIKTGKYVAARGGMVYYLPSCSGAKRISEKNKIWLNSKEEAARFGYKPGKNCKGI